MKARVRITCMSLEATSQNLQQQLDGCCFYLFILLRLYNFYQFVVSKLVIKVFSPADSEVWNPLQRSIRLLDRHADPSPGLGSMVGSGGEQKPFSRLQGVHETVKESPGAEGWMVGPLAGKPPGA